MTDGWMDYLAPGTMDAETLADLGEHASAVAGVDEAAAAALVPEVVSRDVAAATLAAEGQLDEPVVGDPWAAPGPDGTEEPAAEPTAQDIREGWAEQSAMSSAWHSENMLLDAQADMDLS